MRFNRNLPPVVQPELIRDGQLVEVMPEWHFHTFDLSVVHLSNRTYRVRSGCLRNWQCNCRQRFFLLFLFDLPIHWDRSAALHWITKRMTKPGGLSNDA